MAKVIEYIISLKDKLSASINNANNSVNKLEGNISKTNGTLGKLATATGGLFAVSKVLEFGKDIITAGANMEQTRVRFETFTGSLEKGNETIAKLQKFSLDTPFDDDQVLKAGSSLLAFGVGTDELIGKLKNIGNISSATGKDFNELTTIYGKAKTAGTLYAEDINQLVEAGVPIISEFAKQLHKPESAIKKLASEGKIGFNMLEKGFENLGGASGKWGALMDKQSKTLAGKWSSLVGYTQNLMSGLGEGEIPLLNKFVDAAGEILNWVKDNKSKLAELFTPLQKAMQPMQDAFTSISAKLFGTGTITERLNKIFEYTGYVIQLISPFVETAASIVGKLYNAVADVVLVFVKWIKTNKEVQTNLIVLYNAFKTTFSLIGEIAGKVFGGIAKTIDGILNRDFSKIGSGLKDIALAPIEVITKKGALDGFNSKAPTLTNYFAPKSATEAAKDGVEATKKSLAKPGATDAKKDTNKLTTKVGDVAGTKQTTVNVTIQKMVGAENITTNNVKYSIADVERMLKEMLIAGVSDFSILANQQL